MAIREPDAKAVPAEHKYQILKPGQREFELAGQAILPILKGRLMPEPWKKRLDTSGIM